MCREGAWTELTAVVTVGEFTKQTAWIFFVFEENILFIARKIL